MQDIRINETAGGLTAEQQAAIDKLNELMNGPINYYTSDRLPDEIDLIERVRELFVRSGNGHRLPEGFDSSRFIIEAKDRPSHAQQYCLNRWISLQLMACEGSDVVTLYSLIYEIRPDQWLTIFEQYILPKMLELNLPIKIEET